MNLIKPMISVIIPTYNREKFIGEAIQSVLGQTYCNFEIIVVDDGSTDYTEKLVGMIIDPRLQYIRQENNGRSSARNRALKLSKGKYIAFLDSDDLYLPEKLSTQVGYLETHPDVSMIYTSAYCMDENGNPISHRYEAKASGWIYRQIAFFTPVTITLPTVMLRREVLDKVGNFDEKMHRFEDTDLWRRISKYFYIGAMSEPTCKLRTHSDNSLAAQDPHKIEEALSYYVSKIFKEDRSINFFLRCKGVSGIYLYYGRALMTRSAWASIGRKLLFRSIYYWPLNFRSIFYIFAYHLYGNKLMQLSKLKKDEN